jgi:hypothetical protein
MKCPACKGEWYKEWDSEENDDLECVHSKCIICKNGKISFWKWIKYKLNPYYKTFDNMIRY